MNLIALQAVQFTGVRDLPAVDINQRRAFPDNLQPVLSFDHTRGLGQHVFCGAGILQHGTTYGRQKALAGEFGLGHYGSDCGSLQHGGVFFKGDDSSVHRG